MLIGILTCNRLPQLNPADQILIPLLLEKGIKAEPVIWNEKNVNWQSFDYLVVRNIWDYYLEEEAFEEWLNLMEELNIPVLNPIAVIRQNKHKFYLKEFRENGVKIIPTLFSGQDSPASIEDIKAQGWNKIVIKPAVSAGSHLTNIFETDKLDAKVLDEVVSGNDWLIQPFLEEISTNGEISMIFFNGQFSHAILKKPKAGDFRVQSQYGGQYQLFQPDENLIATGQKVITQIKEPLLYGRVDGLMINGEFNLMELELIEPDLYFQRDERIAPRFIEEILRRISGV
jgi:glutathione synthase/RimK-type ligase-like ATP-grasp enzyme